MLRLPASNSRRALIFTLLFAAALAVMALLGYVRWLSYKEALRGAEITTFNYAAITEARLDATLRRADAVLQTLAHEIPREALDPQAVPLYVRDLDAVLDLKITNFAELGGVRIADASGNILYTSDSANTPRVQVADRSYFRAVRDNPQAILAFSEVITARTTGRQSVALARALRDRQGAFRGIVYALLELEHFRKLFQTLDVGANGVMVIRRSDDFTAILRWPALASEVNRALPPGNPVREAMLAGKPQGTLEFAASSDGTVRIYSYRSVAGYPFLSLPHLRATTYWRAGERNRWRSLQSHCCYLYSWQACWVSFGVRANAKRARHSHSARMKNGCDWRPWPAESASMI